MLLRLLLGLVARLLAAVERTFFHGVSGMCTEWERYIKFAALQDCYRPSTDICPIDHVIVALRHDKGDRAA